LPEKCKNSGLIFNFKAQRLVKNQATLPKISTKITPKSRVTFARHETLKSGAKIARKSKSQNITNFCFQTESTNETDSTELQ